MNRFIQDKIALLFVPACVLLSGPAFGQSDECSSDDDCAEGQLCQKSAYIGGCSGGATPTPDEPVTDGPVPEDSVDTPDCDSEPQYSEVGYCYTPPTECDSDADCDEYLSCVESYDSGCAVDSEGNMTCPEPDVDAPKYCSITSVSCTADDDCPRDFECVDVTACLLIACAEGEDECADPCAPTGEKQCNPKQIACTETTDCPSAWSCVGNVNESCSGGGGTVTPDGTVDSEEESGAAGETAPPAGGGTEPAPADGTEPAPDEVTCTTEPAEGVCQPDAWSGNGVYYSTDVLEAGVDEDGSANPAQPTGAPSGESADTRAGGGCSVAHGQQPANFAWVLGLLAAVPLVRRRRSVA